MNKVILAGRLTDVPELKTTSTNNCKLDFTLAVRRRVTSKGVTTDFINCVAWSHNASFINQYFSKGDSISVVGELHNDKYTDKEGKTRYSVKVNVDEIYTTGSYMKK